ncbi:MAG: AraC family transcriptional regulator [Ignavibacteriae bacterium HGW-Ignavibacteriae-1]|nr:MAG: AraC family transcriptional regulator [Ignavibacteriae bacterium HGW-Ignavibacteriae-1]
MKLYIKYMVCIRCKMVVASELENLGIQYKNLTIGEVEVSEDMSDEDKEKLDFNLRRSGLELMNNRKSQIIEKIKNVIIEMVHYTEDMEPVHFSEVLSEKLHLDYTYLSNLFSEVTGVTIQQFVIKHKIERVKELLVYDELNISEIAWKLNYSSVQHLSTQFKKVTGLSPTHFKTLRKKRRQSINEIG